MRRRLDAALDAAVLAALSPPGRDPTDFLSPAGEPALVGPDSLSWQVFANPVSVFVGGVAAVVLELAEPRVRTGVWEHTRFRQAPYLRLQRTGLAAMMTVYGPRSTAKAMIASVVARHALVRGITPTGEAYSAADPVLLRWVHVTAAYGFLRAHEVLGRPLSERERDVYFAEFAPTAVLYGAADVPVSEAGVDALLAETQPRLAPSSIIADFLHITRWMAALPAWLRPLQAAMVDTAVDLLPAWVRRQLQLRHDPTAARLRLRLVRAAAGQVGRAPLPSHPRAQALQRLGLLPARDTQHDAGNAR